MGSTRVELTHVLTQKPQQTLTDDDIEAVIQMATSSRASPDGRQVPLKDTRTQLFVGNLPYRVRWQDLKDLFRKAGTVLRTDVSLGPDNRSRGYGTVLLATPEDASRAVDMFNGYSWQTRILEVRLDRQPPDFENPLGNAAAMAGLAASNSPTNLSIGSLPSNATPTPLGASSASSMLAPTVLQNTDDYDYNSLIGEPGYSGSGGRNLFVGNLPFHCQWQDLKDLFRQAGNVVRSDVALGQDGRSRGFGTVAFATDVDAKRAVQMFNGYEYNGRLLNVHIDRFAQASQSATTTAVPSFRQAPSMSNHIERKPTKISIPTGYTLDFAKASAPSSPFEIYPNHIPSPQQQLLSHQQDNQSSLTMQPPQWSLGVDTSSSWSRAGMASNQGPADHPRSPTRAQQHVARPGRIALPPPAPIFPPIHSYSPPAYPTHHPMSPLHIPQSPLTPNHNHPLLAMTPHGLPPMTPSMPSFNFMPQPSPHGHPATSSNAATMTTPMHSHPSTHQLMSPGVSMSPGSFWSHAGNGSNPFLNPAVGAPVHLSPGGFFGMYPMASQQGVEEPTGYFPPIPSLPDEYFPVTLANEILKGKDSLKRRVDNDSCPSEAATDTGTRDGRPSSSTETSWHDSDSYIGDGGDSARTESRERKLVGPDARGRVLENQNGPQAISRTHSVAPEKPPTRGILGRSDSDPTRPHSREREDVENPKTSGTGISR